MASLMETLIDVLRTESSLYEELLAIAMRKTPVIVSGKLDELAAVSDEEQNQVEKITAADKMRATAMKDIADVMNRDPAKVKLTDIVAMLEKRPQEQAALAKERDRLVDIVNQVRRVNDQNQELLKSSLEMVEFEMNIIQSSRRAPETANYSRFAGTTGDRYGIESGNFNAGA